MKVMIIVPTFSTLLLFALTLVVQSDSREQWTKQKADAWFNRLEWLGGLNLKPHSSIDKLEIARQYHLHKAFWDSAFAFLKEQNLETLPKGKYPIDGDNVFASVTEDSTKSFEKTAWESHRQYADIQYVIRGEEKIGVCEVSKATVTKVYDEKRDVAHYSAKGPLYRANPAVFFIFFPSDAHRPNITPGGNCIDKKIVVKIRVGYDKTK